MQQNKAELKKLKKKAKMVNKRIRFCKLLQKGQMKCFNMNKFKEYDMII